MFDLFDSSTRAEECFFDKVDMGTRLALTFEIAKGNFLDFDVKIFDPTGRIISDGIHETSGIYTFVTHRKGAYTYCFSNRRSTMPNVVMFDMAIDEAQIAQLVKDEGGESANNLEVMIRKLSSALASVRHEQEYTQVRDRVHRSINESTNSRVVLWSFFEAQIVIVMTVWQVFYLKRFF